MLKIAITGSIASGKSYVLNCFSELSVPIFSFDAKVSEILKNDKLVLDKIKSQFPTVIEDKLINRRKLGEIVFYNKYLLNKLENILYPILFVKYESFLKKNIIKNTLLTATEVPLLFEKKLEKLFDQIILVVCSGRTKLTRALKRDGMTNEKFAAIINNQMSDSKKKKLANFVIDTDVGKVEVKNQVFNLMKKLVI